MSKLIVNTGTLSSGGAERVLSILSTPFADEFDEVLYVMWLDAKYPDIFYEIDPRVRIVRISKESGSTNILKQILWFRKYVRKQNPSIVLSFMVMVDFTVTMALLGTGIPQVVAERNDPRFFSGSKILRKFINFVYKTKDVKGILMQTQSNKEYFTSKKLYNKTEVIYNPILMDKSLAGKALKTIKEDLIVSVGRLTKQKSFHHLIEAFSKFHSSHPTYKLCIYGEGEKRVQLQELIEQLSLSDSVLLPGRSNKVMEEICRAKMFVMSSKYEGMSNALLEAMCLGLPCISTKVSGATDLIQEGVNGFLVDYGDTDAIADKMSELANNPDLCVKIGSEANGKYEQLNVDVIAAQWVEYLNKIKIES